MKPRTALRFFLIPALFACPALGAKIDKAGSYAHQPSESKIGGSSFGLLKYVRGRFLGEVREQSPQSALQAIANAAAVRLEISGVLPVTVISRRLANLSLTDAIRRVLSDYSYVMYPEGTGFRIVLLGGERLKSVAEHVSCATPPQTDQAPGCGAEGQSASVPDSLNAFRFIADAQIQANVREPDPEWADEVSKARLKRAQDVLKSQYKHLYQEALIDIIGINDPEASRTLIDAVNTPPNEASRTRMAEFLVTHATNLGFSDREVVSVLQQLAEDQDKEVKNIARQALAEMP